MTIKQLQSQRQSLRAANREHHRAITDNRKEIVRITREIFSMRKAAG